MPADASRLIAGIERWGYAVARSAAQDMPAEVRRSGNVPRKDGELERSIRSTQPTRHGSRSTWQLQAPVIQAATTDRGARPHPIVPRRAGGVLVFHWPKAGGTVFLRRVNHPGNPARPWWTDAVRKAFRESLRRAARSTPF